MNGRRDSASLEPISEPKLPVKDRAESHPVDQHFESTEDAIKPSESTDRRSLIHFCPARFAAFAIRGRVICL